ncbi:GPI-anchored protein LLG1-like [Olea europaea var. sylvestris]|uniref:GPI-anchored protein LORELEI n=1 Tax=Olea europaea subsp. europaea TaxID=158383 RepID=A0A8S0RWZ2_OLEEU|nr:GPI-anchored protein LLG1-like [Olea europaea var. sylvestris]XP_022886532.1 GPI-anchored protein LLG1-like [Olea europaea var. sylvestris]CAA2984735.1 GPI-anchored protein LORELEI [Olea europaea subsp. europaea]
MGLSNFKCYLILAVFLSLFAGLSASTFISDSIFGSSGSTGRNLLQAKKSCPVNFEFQNYTIITSKCKGPLYPPSLCCPAFKDFACQFADDINDLTNECASIMFNYINLEGKYPPGLFSSECKEGKQGLECPALPPSESQSKSERSKGCWTVSKPFRRMILVAVFLVLLQFM